MISRQSTSEQGTMPRLFAVKDVNRYWTGVGTVPLIATFAALMIAAVLPSRVALTLTVDGVHAPLHDFVIVGVGSAAFAASLFGWLRMPIVGYTTLSAVCLIYAMGGLQSSPYLGDHGLLSLTWPLIVYFATPFCAQLLIRALNMQPNVIGVTKDCVCLIAFAYLAALALAPSFGLRIGDQDNRELRLGGPLGNAAMLHIVFLPAVAASIDKLPKFRLPNLASFLLAALALLATVSRAALVSTTIYLCWLLLLNNAFSLKARMLIGSIGLTAVISLLAFSDGVLVHRLSSFEAMHRSYTLETSVRAWVEAPLQGHGFSHIWPFMKRTSELIAGQLANKWDGKTVDTAFGISLWHPHNLIFYFGAEMGLFGLVATIMPLLTIAPLTWRQGRKQGLAVALAASAAVDAAVAGSFVSYPLASLFWWLFALLLVAPSPYCASPCAEPRSSPLVAARELACEPSYDV